MMVSLGNKKEYSVCLGFVRLVVEKYSVWLGFVWLVVGLVELLADQQCEDRIVVFVQVFPKSCSESGSGNRCSIVCVVIKGCGIFVAGCKEILKTVFHVLDDIV